MDGPVGHYAKRNKYASHWKTNTAQFHLRAISKTVKFIESKVEGWSPGAVGRGKWELLINGHHVSVK